MGLYCYWKITSRWNREEKCWVYRFCSLTSYRVLFEGLEMGAGSFGDLQLMENGATRPVRLVTSSLWGF